MIQNWDDIALRTSEIVVQAALKEVILGDEIPANRLMAAQALGLCGDADRAFSSLMKEVKKTKRGYVFLQGINAFQYSQTDQMLTKEDWEKFKAREWNIPEGKHDFGVDYAGRIIADALELWPERRKVY